MSTTNKVPSGMAPALQNIFMFVLEALGLKSANVPDPFSRMTLQTTPDGQSINCTVMSLGGLASDSVATINSLTQQPVETPRTQNPVPGGSLTGLVGVLGTLVAGTVTVTLANKAGDMLYARLSGAEGGSGGIGCYSCQSASATTVKVNSQTAAGALASSDTSVVEVYNLGNPAA